MRDFLSMIPLFSAYLKKPLDLYIQRFPVPVHLVHLKQRSGLIRARLEGSKLSKGKVRTFS